MSPPPGGVPPERAQLLALPLDELRVEASERGIEAAATLDREALVRAILEAAGVRRSERRNDGFLSAPPRAPSSYPEQPSSTGPARLHHAPGEHDTETMAGLYLRQGFPERAAEIYRRLLALRPDDATLARRLAECEDAIQGLDPESLAPPPSSHATRARPSDEPFGLLDFEELPDGYGVDECELIARDPHHLFAYWELTNAGISAARGHLAADAAGARLVLRLFITSSGDRGVVRDTRDHDLPAHRGRRYLPSPRPGVVVRAAIGLASPGGLFAPIAHSSSLRVPYAEPARPTPLSWIEVVPAPLGAAEPGPIEILRSAAIAAHVERAPAAESGAAVPPPLGYPRPGAGPSSPSGKR